jgi:hypothetical protein
LREHPKDFYTKHHSDIDVAKGNALDIVKSKSIGQSAAKNLIKD